MSDNAPVSPDDQSTPEQCLSKLTALIKYIYIIIMFKHVCVYIGSLLLYWKLLVLISLHLVQMCHQLMLRKYVRFFFNFMFLFLFLILSF